MTVRDDLNNAAKAVNVDIEAEYPDHDLRLTDDAVVAVTDAILDALASRVPSVCPSGFDWTAGDIEDWLRAVKEGRA